VVTATQAAKWTGLTLPKPRSELENCGESLERACEEGLVFRPFALALRGCHNRGSSIGNPPDCISLRARRGDHLWPFDPRPY